MAVWDSTVDCDQNLVRSPPNETELSAGPPRPVNYGECGKHRELFHKSNVLIAAAHLRRVCSSAWLGDWRAMLPGVEWRG